MNRFEVWLATPPCWAASFLLLVTTAAFAGCLQAGTIWDDNNVFDNPLNESWQGLGQIWFQPTAIPNEFHYWPLTYTTLWVEYQIWRDNVVGYHLTNVLFHLANTLLLLNILRRMGIAWYWWATLLFALHPLRVESVAWIIERKDVQSLFFYLLSWRSLLAWWETRNRGDWRFGLFFYVCAIFSKSMTLSLPAAWLVYIWWKDPTRLREAARNMAPFFAVGLLYAVLDLTYGASRSGFRSGYTLFQRIAMAGMASFFYLGKFLWPRPLLAIYPKWDLPSNQVVHLVGPTLLLGLTVLLIAWSGRWGRGPAACTLFFVGSLLPVLGFIDYSYMRHALVADRFTYQPGLALGVLAAGGASWIWPRLGTLSRRVMVGLLLAHALMLGWLTHRQTLIYRNQETLFAHTLAWNPQAAAAYVNYGLELASRGLHEEGMVMCRRALAALDDYPLAFNNLGIALINARGDIHGAIANFQQALTMNPSFDVAQRNLNIALMIQPKVAMGWQDPLPMALRATLAAAQQAAKIGEFAVLKRDFASGHRQFLKALELIPPFAAAHSNLGLTYLAMGKPVEAIQHLEEASRLLPNWVIPLHTLARIRAANPDPSLRNATQAIQLATRVCQLTNFRNPLFLDTLACAYAEAGRFHEAVFAERLALKYSYLVGDYAFTSILNRRLQMFLLGSPLREQAQLPPEQLVQGIFQISPDARFMPVPALPGR